MSKIASKSTKKTGEHIFQLRKYDDFKDLMDNITNKGENFYSRYLEAPLDLIVNNCISTKYDILKIKLRQNINQPFPRPNLRCR